MTTRAPHPRRWDRLTILVYLMAGLFGLVIGSLGPAMPLIRSDIGITRTIGGLHFTMIAGGAVVAGFLTERSSRRWGRRRVAWLGTAGVAIGAAGISVAPNPVMSLVSTVLIGIAGAMMLATVQSTLADQHPDQRASFLTEGNTATSIGTALPSVFVGGSVALGFGWRPIFIVPGLLCVFAFLRLRAEPFPAASPTSAAGADHPLPTSYWLFWAGVIPAVAAEWSVGAWAAGYMIEVGGASVSAASALMMSYFGTIVLGRMIGSVMARSIRPQTLLLVSSAIGLPGLVLFWSADRLALIVVGLCLAGLGISALYPMLLSMAVETAPTRTGLATSRFAIAAGSAVIIAPVTLGAVADRSGIRPAFGLVPLLLIAVAVFAVLGGRLGASAAPTPTRAGSPPA